MIETSTLYPILIILLAIGGFTISEYIYRKKKSGQSLVCPLKGHCDPVINSKYSEIMGVPVVLIGMFYYGAIMMSELFIILQPHDTFKLVVLVASAGSFLFSIYLTGIQAFLIKNYCTWCLGSAAISTLIFVFSLLVYLG